MGCNYGTRFGLGKWVVNMGPPVQNPAYQIRVGFVVYRRCIYGLYRLDKVADLGFGFSAFKALQARGSKAQAFSDSE